MAKIPDIIKNKINRFIELLEADQIHIQKAVLYGSYAKGNSDKWSDIDLALISEDFLGDSFADKLSLRDYIYETGCDISPMPYRPDDFDNSMFARDEILKYGIVVKE